MLLSVSAQTHFAADFKGPIIGNGKAFYLYVVIDLFSRWPVTENQDVKGLAMTRPGAC